MAREAIKASEGDQINDAQAIGLAFDEATRRLEFTREQLHKALEALARIKKLHRPDKDEPGFCGCCGFSWPCETIRAIGFA